MDEIDERDSKDVGDAAATNGNGRRNGNGDPSGDERVGEPQYFLDPLQAGDPVLYLFDGDGNRIDAEGNPIGGDNGVPPAIRKLQEEALEGGDTADPGVPADSTEPSNG